MCAGTGEPPRWRLSLSTGKMPVVPAPSGSEGGGGICAMRGRATGRLCVVIRGVVSDAVPCLFNGVICDLPFNVVGLPKKTGGMIAHHSMICQSLHATFCGGKNGSPNRNITECSLSARSRRFAALLCVLCVLCGSTVFRCIRESCNNYEEPSRTMRHMYKMVFQHVQARFPA